jgi:hypothetical protein
MCDEADCAMIIAFSITYAGPKQQHLEAAQKRTILIQ